MPASFVQTCFVRSNAAAPFSNLKLHGTDGTLKLAFAVNSLFKDEHISISSFRFDTSDKFGKFQINEDFLTKSAACELLAMNSISRLIIQL